MNVLLLHPDDSFPSPRPAEKWDLVVDLGRAPSATYETWAREAGCRVISLYDFAEEIEDVYRIKDLFKLGKASVVDRHGIDWWDVLCPLLLPSFQQALMLRRLSEDLQAGCHLYASRPDPRASALQSALGAKLSFQTEGGGPRRVQHYWRALSRLSARQIKQICQDKFDPQHAIRRRLAPRRPSSRTPTVLLPSAYSNVSRTAVSYAALLPDQHFLLVLARREGRIETLPANVGVTSLDSYYRAEPEDEIRGLVQAWGGLRSLLASSAPEFQLADEAGLLARMPGLIRWGVAARDAWNNVLQSENIVGCFSADDANPYTSIPLILAKSRGLATLACHHGAMDYRMGIKDLYADFYLAKGELERDYLLRQCRLAPERVVMGGAPRLRQPQPVSLLPAAERRWLVFFTEPYGSDGWRIEEVYRDLLPRLFSLAETCGLELVFKLHPFESIKGHQRLLRKVLPRGQASGTRIIAGPLSPELWRNTAFAITGQSTVAMEAAALGLPVFLCGWLRGSCGGYILQYARFGIGTILNSSDEIADIPRLLKSESPPGKLDGPRMGQAIAPSELRNLLTGVCSLPAANAS